MRDHRCKASSPARLECVAGLLALQVDILSSPEGGRDAPLGKWDLPGSLKPALHGAMRVWSHMLLPQA